MAYTKEIINVGSTVDDGTGDLLRDAFTKVNTNFTAIWDTGAVNSNLNLTEFSITSDGDLILNPTTDVLIKKKTIINSDKGDFDLIVHGDTADNVLFVDASTNRVGILNSAPTVALDVTGSAKVSGGTTTNNLSVTGNATLGSAISDLITLNGRIGSDILPNGSRSIGSVTNRFATLSVTDIDATGTISGTFTGTISPATTITNNINSTTIVADTIQATTSAEVGNLLVTGTLAVQGSSVTIDSATMQILDKLTFEGATPDDFETNIVATDATADRTITLPDADGNIALFTTAPTGAIADGTAGQVLTTDGAGALSFTTASGGASAINDLSDVTITTPSNTEVLKYNGSAWVNAAGGIGLTDLSVSVAAAGSANLTYDDSSGSFEFTPPDLSSYLTSYTVTESDVTTHQAALSVTKSQISDLATSDTDFGANKILYSNNYANLVDLPSAATYHGMFAHVHATGKAYYSHAGAWLALQQEDTLNADIDAHLNQSNPTSGHVLSWNGTDYAWVSNAGGGAGISLTDLSVGAEGAASGDGSLAYDNSTGVFTYTPPDLSSYITGYTVTESDVTTHQAALSITESQISDLQSYLTSVSEANVTAHQAALSITESQISDLGTYQTVAGLNGAIDTHLNQSNPTSGYVLTWNGTDYAWTANGTGSGIGDIVDDTSPQLGGDLDANGNDIDMGTNVITDTKVGQWDTSYSWGNHASAGYLTAETNDLSSAVTWANVPDANITSSSVVQHQANLSITESQISDLGSYSTASNFVQLNDTPATISGQNGKYIKADGSGTALIFTDLEIENDSSPVLGGTLQANGNDIDMGTNVLTDTNLGQFITAYGWGDHGSAGYQTTAGLNAAIDSHLNQTDPDSGYVLSWNGTDYAWVDNGAYTSFNSDFDTRLAAKDTGDLAEGSNLYYTDARADTRATLRITAASITNLSDVDTVVAGDDGKILYYDHSSTSFKWKADAGSTFGLAGNTGTHTFDPSTETLTFLGTTGQINAGIAANNVTLELDSNINSIVSIAFEGTTSNANETKVQAVDPSGDNTIELPDKSGTFALEGDHPVHSFNVSNNGATDYVFSDDDNHWFPTSENDPVLYLRRGDTYNFVVSAGGSHPFEIRTGSGGSAYNTGVTNNGTGSGTIVFKVPMSAPATLYYQCTNHAGMGNTINIV